MSPSFLNCRQVQPRKSARSRPNLLQAEDSDLAPWSHLSSVALITERECFLIQKVTLNRPPIPDFRSHLSLSFPQNYWYESFPSVNNLLYPLILLYPHRLNWSTMIRCPMGTKSCFSLRTIECLLEPQVFRVQSWNLLSFWPNLRDFESFLVDFLLAEVVLLE